LIKKKKKKKKKKREKKMDLKEEIYEAYGDKLGETTKRQSALKISNWLSYTPYETVREMVEHPEECKMYLESSSIKQTVSNYHVHMSAMVSYITHVLEDEQAVKPWKEMMRENWSEIAERYDENRPSDLQKGKIMDWEEIIEKRDKLEYGSMERLLLSFYTKIEPIRADYFATELVEEEEEEEKEKADNYIRLGTGELVVRDFKMKRKYDKIENRISEELMDELRVSLEKNPRMYLFVMEDKKPYQTRKAFSNWACRVLTRVLNHPMTLTVLRHLYIMNNKEKSGKELTEIAKRMGHSRMMQRVYEWK